MDSVNTWLWLGLAGMGIGSVILALLTQTMRTEDKHHGYLAVSITLIATVAYFALATNLGDIVRGDVTVQSARYFDWVLTTPLLLISLLLVALPNNKAKTRYPIIGLAVILDVFMIATGYIAEIVTDGSRWAWFAFSCAAFLGVLYLLFVTAINVSKKVYGKRVAKLYTNLAAFLAVLWFGYPIIWLLGANGYGSVDLRTQNALYAVFDVTAKVGFGILLLTAIVQAQKNAKPKKGHGTVESLSK